MTLSIRTLGGLQVWDGPDELADLPAQRIKSAVLLYVAVERSAPRSDLLLMLWPDRPEDRARHSLSQALYELRQDVGDRILTPADRLQIANDVDVDATRFREAVSTGDHRRALELYRGPFLAGAHLLSTREFEGWVDSHRSRLAMLRRKASSVLVQQLAGEDRLPEALFVAREWVAADPLDDGAQHILIELLARSGNRIEALKRYEEYRALLESELDAPPLEQTQNLVERIRRGEGASPPALPEGGAGRAPAPRHGQDWTVDELADALAGHLELRREVGRGTMARVYLAWDPALRRDVAVKVLRAEWAADTTVRLRFEREARSAARVHEATDRAVTVYGVGTLPSGVPFIEMEFVHGRTLAEYMEAVGRVSVSEAYRILIDVASALAAAHRLHIVHRDLRPANILVREGSGQALLTDFGLAAVLDPEQAGYRLTLTGDILGQPLYRSPEQQVGGPITAVADVYSFGVLAYELLATSGSNRGPQVVGRLLSEGARVSELREGVPPALDDLLERCRADSPARRPTASQVLAELEALRDGGAGTAVARADPGAIAMLWNRRVPHTALGVGLTTIAASEGAGLLAEAGFIGAAAYERFLDALVAFVPVVLAAALVVAWFHGERGPQRVERAEVVLLGAIGLAGVVIAFLFLF